MHSFAWWPTVIVVAVATFTDLRSRRIPNWLVLPFLGLGIVVSSCASWRTWSRSEPGRRGIGTADLRGSVLGGRHGRRRRKTLRGNRSLDRPIPVVSGPGDDGTGRGSDGAGMRPGAGS